jgi:hypothetical protein
MLEGYIARDRHAYVGYPEREKPTVEKSPFSFSITAESVDGYGVKIIDAPRKSPASELP